MRVPIARVARRVHFAKTIVATAGYLLFELAFLEHRSEAEDHFLALNTFLHNERLLLDLVILSFFLEGAELFKNIHCDPL